MAGPRKLFEDVATDAAAAQAATPLPKTGLIDAGRGAPGARRGLRLWVFSIFLLVVAMIVVGGLTRLTDSGLSITVWDPIHGAIPPLSSADWTEEFAKYQATPEYQLQNKGMSLAEFQVIFWWEWGHRFLARVVGVVWAVGFIGFLLARKMPTGWTGRLFLLGALGGLQGGIGWWMVHSGLSGDRVDVASYRLATHLGLAFIILGLAAWHILALSRDEADLMRARRAGDRSARIWSTALLHLTFVQIILGALVAGIDAGRGFPTWPDMNGQFFPADAFYVPGGAAWRAFLENPGLVQFNHRLVGYLLLVLAIVAWFKSRKAGNSALRHAFLAVMIMMFAQMTLGIITALTAATLSIAITHQIGAILLWVLIIRARHLSIYPVQGSIRKGTQ